MERTRSTIQKRDAKGVIRHGAEWLALWSDPDSMKTRAEKAEESAAVRARVAAERSLAAAARSLSGDLNLRIEFDANEIPSLRGQSDSIAFQRRFHDAALHERTAPKDRTRRLFDLCERLRCEALGARLFPGVGENLIAQQTARMRKNDLLGAHLALLIPVSEAVEMVLRDALLNAPDPSIASSGMWMWDRWIRERFSTNLAELKAAIADQSAFAIQAAAFVAKLISEVGEDKTLKPLLPPSPEQGGDQPDDRLRESINGSILRPDVGEVSFVESTAGVRPAPYKAFTQAHDRIVSASDLFDPRRLHELRTSMEERHKDIRRDLAKLTSRLQRRLLAKQTRDWSFDLDEGLLDASRLDRVIVNPGFASAYKRERESNFPDTVVTLLIDNSGSMRGKPIEVACLAADLLSAALDRCGIASEILGFTTREWKGGQSAKEWARAGRPENPGRLNDLLHVVYKAAGEPARRSRTNLAAMLDPDLLKENVDGEALLWASRRLLARPESRRILIVISDGAPVDQATLENNSDKQVLDRHLRQVISEADGELELLAIGVKHDVTQYYAKSVNIESADKLGASLIAMVDRNLCSSVSICG